MHVGILSNFFKTNSGNKEVEDDLFEVGTLIKKALDSSGHKATFFDVNKDTFNDLKEKKIDFTFNVCERFENDPHKEHLVPEMLEKLKIPYTGSGSIAISSANNKAVTKELLVKHNISTPKFQIFKDYNDRIKDDLQFPLIVKPTLEHNSIGITQNSVVNSETELRECVKNIIKNFKQPCLVEEFIKGRDIEIGILGNGDNLEILPLAEVGYEKFKGNKNELIFSYEGKWNTKSDVYGDYIFPKDIPESIELKMKKIAAYLYNLAGINDYGRIDFRLKEDNTPYVIEITANPGLSMVCSASEAYKHMGLKYSDLINKIFNHALERYKIKKSEITSQI
tara:strand:+ start:519 stop:1529 length:1011 start_codon:yes stop_codon:yes gene_type:complete